MIIDTRDRYIQNLIVEHPKYREMFKEISMRQQAWIHRYGEVASGMKYTIDDRDYDDELIENVKRITVDLLTKLLDVCDKNGLRVYLMYGSLLGAVRDDGIIHGDDDIDVALMRSDYDKLLELAKNGAFEEPFFLQTPENDNCFYGGFSKLRNSLTTAIHPQNWWVECNEGIFIDIFPIDVGYSDERKEKRKKRRLLHIQRLLYAKAYGYFPRFKDMPILIWKMYKYVGKLWTRQQLAAILDAELKQGDMDCEKLGIYTHYMGEGAGRNFDKKAFDEVVDLNYEGLRIAAPAGWNQVLIDLYGTEYVRPLTLPINKLRHGFYNVDVPYMNYKNRFQGLFKPMPSMEKKIVLVGDREIFELYKKRYSGSQYHPYAEIELCEGSSQIDNTIEKGYSISDDEVTKLSDVQSIYLVICAIDVRAAESIVRSIGFREYYIFWYDRRWMQLANYCVIKDEAKRIIERKL